MKGLGLEPAVGGGAPLKASEVLERLRRRYGEKARGGGLPSRPPHAIVDRSHLLPVLAFLRDDPSLLFDVLVDVTAVDHLRLALPGIGERFSVVYQLLSLVHGHRFEVKTEVPEEDPRVPSASALWRSALWGEREVHDMFAILFEGNPDMRRLLMPEGFAGYPLRKDYPLAGRGERDAFPKVPIVETASGPGGAGTGA